MAAVSGLKLESFAESRAEAPSSSTTTNDRIKIFVLAVDDGSRDLLGPPELQ